MGFDAGALLMALAVILLPQLLAGVLLSRPTRSQRTDSLNSNQSNETP